MQKRMTMTMDEGLVRIVRRRRVSAFSEGLARPDVIDKDLVEIYMASGLDTKPEQEALDWSGPLIGDASHAAGQSVMARL